MSAVAGIINWALDRRRKAAQKPVSNLIVTISLHGVFCPVILPPLARHHQPTIIAKLFQAWWVKKYFIHFRWNYFSKFEEVQVHELLTVSIVHHNRMFYSCLFKTLSMECAGEIRQWNISRTSQAGNSRCKEKCMNMNILWFCFILYKIK